MKTVREISNKLGQGQMAKRLDVGVTAVNNAIQRGTFPARWFTVVRGMLAEEGVTECPECAFNFKSPVSLDTE